MKPTKELIIKLATFVIIKIMIKPAEHKIK